MYCVERERGPSSLGMCKDLWVFGEKIRAVSELDFESSQERMLESHLLFWTQQEGKGERAREKGEEGWFDCRWS